MIFKLGEPYTVIRPNELSIKRASTEMAVTLALYGVMTRKHPDEKIIYI